MSSAEPLIITASLSQRTYPGARVLDDCVPVATIQAYGAEPGHERLPTVEVFRAAAGVPHGTTATGMTVAEAGKAARALWPATKVEFGTFTWPNFGHAMESGRRPASVTVSSGALPAHLQYGFQGLHQITAWYQNGEWWMTNPLQHEGSAPNRITAHELHAAAGAFAGGGNVAAVIFPTVPDPGPSVAELAAQVLSLTTALEVAKAKLSTAKAHAAAIDAL